MNVSINKLCLACDVLKFVRGYLVADLCNSSAVAFLGDEVCCMNAELSREYAVVSARSTSAEHMTRNAYSCLYACVSLDLSRNTSRSCDNTCFSALLCAFFLFHLSFRNIVSSLSDCKDRESLARCASCHNGVANLIDIVRNFGDYNDISSAGNTCIEREPASLVSHYLADKDSRMACCGSVETINYIGCDINSRMETKGNICSVDIVVDSFRQTNNIESLVRKEF